MHIIALSTNLFAIFNLFFVKKHSNTVISFGTYDFSWTSWNFLLWNNFYFRKCLRQKMFSLKKVYVEKILLRFFFTPKNFQFFSLVHRLRIFLSERNKYRLNSFRIFRMETGKRSASDSFGRRYTNKVTISCRRWIKCLANERASERVSVWYTKLRFSGSPIFAHSSHVHVSHLTAFTPFV